MNLKSCFLQYWNCFEKKLNMSRKQLALVRIFLQTQVAISECKVHFSHLYLLHLAQSHCIAKSDTWSGHKRPLITWMTCERLSCVSQVATHSSDADMLIKRYQIKLIPASRINNDDSWIVVYILVVCRNESDSEEDAMGIWYRYLLSCMGDRQTWYK